MALWLSSRGAFRWRAAHALGGRLLAVALGVAAFGLSRDAAACSAVWLQTVTFDEVADVPVCLALEHAQELIDVGSPRSPSDMNRRAALRVSSTCKEAHEVGCDGCVDATVPAGATVVVQLPPGQGAFAVTWTGDAAAGAFIARVSGEWSDCGGPFGTCSASPSSPSSPTSRGPSAALAAAGLLGLALLSLCRARAWPSRPATRARPRR